MNAFLGHVFEHNLVNGILIKKRRRKKNLVVSGLDFFLYLVMSLLFFSGFIQFLLFINILEKMLRNLELF